MDKRETILDVARSEGYFKTFLKAVKAAGLEDTLKGKGPFTVFAPTDEAFARMPKTTMDSLLKSENKKKLAELLKGHVVNGRTMAAAIKSADLKTLGGSMLKVKADASGVHVNAGRVVESDIDCANGVIHAIDTVAVREPATAKSA